jgi:two-component system LytT family response regulator
VISTLIVEDEPFARQRLRQILEGLGGVAIVGECADVASAASICERESPQLVLLDVTLAGSNGFDFLDAIPSTQRPAVIFVTAASEHACRAFAYDAVDFLLKPFTTERLASALNKARRRLNNPAENQTKPSAEHLTVKCQRRYVRIPFKEITVLVADNQSCKIFAGKETYSATKALASFERELPLNFVRINRGEIINTEYVRMIHPKSHGDGIVELATGQSHVLSRLYRERLEAAIGFT